MLGVLDHFWSPVVQCYALKTPVGLLIGFIAIFTHVTTITIISYAVTRLHNYNPYTFVTTITYSTLTRLHFTNTTL
jgi:hypothetical protein